MKFATFSQTNHVIDEHAYLKTKQKAAHAPPESSWIVCEIVCKIHIKTIEKQMLLIHSFH